MAKKYDEAKAIASVSKKAVVNYGDKTISYNPNNHQIGNGTWGKIDFLVHYCGWHLIKDNSATKIKVKDDNSSDTPKAKKETNKVKKMK